jgi:GGDEF domain-containing protein
MVGSNTLDIESAMSKIRNIVLLPISYGALSLQVGTSIGHAAFPDHSTDLAKLMKLADTAMYQDKQHSKKIPIAG